MGTNRFTEEQQKELSNNPFIQKVSETSITYTQEFKERLAIEYQQGKPISQILIGMGIDHHVLGKKRKSGLVQRMKKYELRPEGCADIRKGNSGRPTTKDLSDNEKISRLVQKVRYLQQENEFLKKNVQINRAAEYNLKQTHLKNTD